jgi:hypothetical protein
MIGSIRAALLACLLVASAGYVGAEDAAKAAKTEAEIAVESRLSDVVKYLASDELEGRGVGTKGLDKAADYLAEEFRKLGLSTEVIDGKPFQQFTVTANQELGAKENNRLALVGPPAKEGEAPRRTELKLAEDFSPLAIGGSGKLESDLIFVGYGITAKDKDYDDYAGLEVKDKVVVMLRKEPQQDNPHSKFEGNQASDHATFNRKVANAFEHGVAGVIIVNDHHDVSGQSQAERKRWQAALDKLAEKNAEFAKIESPTDEQFQQHVGEVEKLAKQLSESTEKLKKNSFDRVLGFMEAGAGSRKTMPVIFAARDKVDPIIKEALGKDLATIEREIDEDLKPRSGVLTGWKADGVAEVITKPVDIKNVIAVLEGEGPLAEETVIVGAHYDHLGMGGSGTFAPWTVAVHNGADDNASGTAALLEVARSIAAREGKPRRRVVFMAFTGEERGLLGSAHYVKNPRWPLDKTVAMVNMDMVGRLKDNKLIVYGTGTAKEFDGLVDKLNEKHAFVITKKPEGVGPSDHAAFYPMKVPVFHIFTGTHSDYHRPSDDWDKINYEGIRRVADFVTDLTTSIVDADTRPEYIESARPQVAARGGNRPYLGTIPDFSQEVEGYALQGVAPGGPAEKAGMKAGDAIVEFGESKIGGLDDIDSALRKFKAGDKVKVVVLRDKERVTLEVVLDPPR